MPEWSRPAHRRRSSCRRRVAARWAVAGALWAVALAQPATSPPVRRAPTSSLLSYRVQFNRAVTDRTRFLAVAASRAEPAPELPSVVWPAAGALTGWFGERRGGHRHPGVDIDGGTGDPVVAAARGSVVHAGPSATGYSGYGTMVILDHGEGLTSIYAHLSAVAVKAGEEVGPGHRIGSVGSSGSSTGSHLHFELRRGGAAVDPRSWLPGR